METARVARYAEAIHGQPAARILTTDGVVTDEVRAVMTVADEEQAELRGLADRLAAALAIAAFDAHPTYGSTAGWRGGIGGAAMTTGCSMIDPPPGDDWMAAGYGMLSDPLRDYLRARERDGSPLDLDAAKEALASELRSTLGA